MNQNIGISCGKTSAEIIAVTAESFYNIYNNDEHCYNPNAYLMSITMILQNKLTEAVIKRFLTEKTCVLSQNTFEKITNILETCSDDELSILTKIICVSSEVNKFRIEGKELTYFRQFRTSIIENLSKYLVCQDKENIVTTDKINVTNDDESKDEDEDKDKDTDTDFVMVNCDDLHENDFLLI